MRGNDVVLELDEKLNKVFVVLKVQLLTQPVTPYFNAAEGNIKQGRHFFTTHIHAQVSAEFKVVGYQVRVV